MRVGSSDHIESHSQSAGTTSRELGFSRRQGEHESGTLGCSTYVVYYDGDLFRAYHSDVAEMPLASVQDLNSNDRKYAYVVWKLSSDRKRLTLRSINKVIPKETKDSAAVAALLTKNARNPELFGEEIEFRKEK